MIEQPVIYPTGAVRRTDEVTHCGSVSKGISQQPSSGTAASQQNAPGGMLCLSPFAVVDHDNISRHLRRNNERFHRRQRYVGGEKALRAIRNGTLVVHAANIEVLEDT